MSRITFTIFFVCLHSKVDDDDKELCEMMSNLSSQDNEEAGSATLAERLGVSTDILDLMKALGLASRQKYEELGGDPDELGGGLGVLDCTIADDELFQSPPP